MRPKCDQESATRDQKSIQKILNRDIDPAVNLWLDWNNVEELPTEFSQLIKLKNFSVTGNPMRSPTMDVVAQGCEYVKQWCSKRAEFNLKRKRVNVIRSLQSLFAAIVQVKKADPDLSAYFEVEAHEKETNRRGNPHRDTYEGT